MKKNSTAPRPSASTYARRQHRRAESIILATGVYDADFRRSVQKALELYKKGQPSNLPRLMKEADEIHRQQIEFSDEIFARMNADVRERAAIQEKANKIEALISGPKLTSAEINRSRAAFLKYAVKSLLIELSNESQIGVNEPGIAGIFYMLAANILKDSAGETEQRCLRHLDILLSDPKHKTVKTMMEYWDGNTYGANDPFPSTATSSQEEPVAAPTVDEQEHDLEIERLQEKLAKLELLPENEAVRFNLESEIYKLERQDNEWPDVISETGGHHGSL